MELLVSIFAGAFVAVMVAAFLDEPARRIAASVGGWIRRSDPRSIRGEWLFQYYLTTDFDEKRQIPSRPAEKLIVSQLGARVWAKRDDGIPRFNARLHGNYLIGEWFGPPPTRWRGAFHLYWSERGTTLAGLHLAGSDNNVVVGGEFRLAKIVDDEEAAHRELAASWQNLVLHRQLAALDGYPQIALVEADGEPPESEADGELPESQASEGGS